MTKKLGVILVSCLVIIIIVVISLVSKAGVTPTTKDSIVAKTIDEEKVCTLLQASSDLYSETSYGDFFNGALFDLLNVTNPSDSQQAQIEIYATEGFEKMKMASADFKIAFDSVLTLKLNNKDELKNYGSNCELDIQSLNNSSLTSWALGGKNRLRYCDVSLQISDIGWESGNSGMFWGGGIGVMLFCDGFWD